MIDTLINLTQTLLAILFIVSLVALVYSRTHDLLFAAVASAALLGMGTFLLGELRLLYSVIFFSIGVLVIAFGGRLWISDAAHCIAEMQSHWQKNDMVLRVLIVLMVIRTLLIFIGGTMQLPFGGTEEDVLHYHLVLPKVYLAQHSIAALSWSIPDKYPLLFHMMYLSGYSVLGPLFAKSVIFCAYLGSVGLVWLLIYRQTSAAWAWWGAAIFSGLPAIVIQAGTAMIDLLTLFFLLAALEGLLRYQKNGRTIDLISSAMASGIIAAARCFTVSYSIILIMLFIVCARPKTFSWKQHVRLGIWYAGIIFMFYAPWAWRAFYLTGNPFYPLAAHWLGGSGLDAARLAGIADVRWAYGYGKGVLNLLRLPWDMTFHATAFDYPIGPVILAFLPLGFCYGWRGKKDILLAALLLFALLWFMGSQQTRYFFFPLALLVVYVSRGWAGLETHMQGDACMIHGLLLFVILLSLPQAYRQYGAGWKRLRLGESNRDFVLTHVKQADMLESVDLHFPASAHLLLLDTWPSFLYYFPRFFVQGGSGILSTTFWDLHAQSPEQFRTKAAQFELTGMVADRSTVDLQAYIDVLKAQPIAQTRDFVLYRIPREANNGKL